MATYPKEVTQRFDGPPGKNGLVREPPRGWRRITVEDYDPAWPHRYAALSATLHDSLTTQIAGLEHVGSTSVPGLAAKPIIDIDLLLAGTEDEQRYAPRLERLGYVLVLREPWWYGHRMYVDDAEDVHLHVWPESAPEPVRHRLFRDWLRTHPADRDLYAATKRRLATATADGPTDYTLAKSTVIDEIFARIFAATP